MKQWRPTLKFLIVATMALGGLAAGCAPADSTSDPDAGMDGGTCTTYSQVTIWPKCTTCHSSTVTGAARMDATVGIDFDTYDSAKAQGSQAQVWVTTGLMPPAPMPAATDADKASLKAWIDCGMPK